MKNKIAILFFLLIFLGKVTGAISCLIDRYEITACHADAQEKDSPEDEKECSDGEDEENADALYHQKVTHFRCVGFIEREKFKVVDFFIPSPHSLEITSPPPEVYLPNC
jgi:hypothetical protein